MNVSVNKITQKLLGTKHSHQNYLTATVTTPVSSSIAQLSHSNDFRFSVCFFVVAMTYKIINFCIKISNKRVL